MKVIIVGATGAIGGIIMQHLLCRKEITQVIALTRRALPIDNNNNDGDSTPSNPKLKNILIPDFGDLSDVPDSTWTLLRDADALVWAMGTYDLNEAVNLNYPLAFQDELAKRLHRQPSPENKFRFFLLGGAFVEPDQSRTLYFLSAQRRMKGVLQTKTLEIAESRKEGWEATVVRPGGVLFGGDTYVNCLAGWLFGRGLAIRAEELGACVADLVVCGGGGVVGNKELVERGRKVLDEGL